jgi:CRP-like cAMP-binding protein
MYSIAIMTFAFNHKITSTGPFRTFLNRYGTKVTFRKNETIVRPGDTQPFVYVIDQGFVKVYTHNNRDDQYVHVIYGPSEIFPLAMLTSPLPPTVTYSAFTDCILTRVPQSAISEAMNTDLAVTRVLTERAINQFRLYSARLDNLQYKFARERLIYRLLFLAGRYGVREPDGTYLIDIPMTQQLIGDSINLSRESVSREFDRLRSMGLIGYRDQNLYITDWRKLSTEFKEPVHAEWWGLE